MRVRLLSIALVVLALTVLAASPVEARHRDRDRDRRFDRRSRVIVVDRSPRVVFQDRGFFVDRSPRVTVFQERDFSDRPHGWNRGRKVGWGNCDLPPGLAKKYGCHSSFRDRRVNRRPVVILPIPFVRF